MNISTIRPPINTWSDDKEAHPLSSLSPTSKWTHSPTQMTSLTDAAENCSSSIRIRSEVWITSVAVVVLAIGTVYGFWWWNRREQKPENIQSGFSLSSFGHSSVLYHRILLALCELSRRFYGDCVSSCHHSV
ncbi:hypothetical protein F4818DRAFT_429144, partial [Hypoxylon cercidicola]